MALVLGIYGEKFSGKDTAADYLATKYNVYHIRHSHILDKILTILDIPVSRRNEIDLGMALRGAFGEGVIIPAIRKAVQESNADIKIIQSIRFPEELENAKNLGAKLIYITAPLEIRYERSKTRTEKADDQGQTVEEFKQMELEPTEIQIPELGKQADYRIDNIGTLEELYQKLDEIVEKLKTS